MPDKLDSEKAKFRSLLSELGFADRYYAYCAKHPTRGPEVPLQLQTSMLAETGRTFRYNKGEKFFAWRDAEAPDGCELGLNVKLDIAQVEWILVFKTPAGHVGSTFAVLALNVKQIEKPGYKHNPPYPVPNVASKAELATIIDEGFALYGDVAAAIAKQKWK